MDIYRRTNGWFDDNDPCWILSWRRTIVIWSTFEPTTVLLLARKSITKHVLLRAKKDAWIFIGRTNGWFDDNDPCWILSWRRTIVIWSTFEPITVPLLARKSITKHVLLRARNDAWIFIGGPTGDSTITIPVRFCREEEQSSFDQLSNQSRFFCLLESPSRNMFFFAQKMTHGYLSADQRVIRR